jgi:hypothetical protein
VAVAGIKAYWGKCLPARRVGGSYGVSASVNDRGCVMRVAVTVCGLRGIAIIRVMTACPLAGWRFLRIQAAVTEFERGHPLTSAVGRTMLCPM